MTTRRILLKTLFGTVAGFSCFGLFSFMNNTKQVLKPLSASVIANKVTQPPHLSQHIINKPFINALNHIVTPTYDDSGQAVHPSVIDFKTEYGLDNWGGFRYWMALTPYPHFNSDFENPSFLVSKDGLSWCNPPGIKEPLVSKPIGSLKGHFNNPLRIKEPLVSKPIGSLKGHFNNPLRIKAPLVSKPIGSLKENYNSDPELVFDPDLNTLTLYWREYSQNAFEKIWAKKFSSTFKQSDKILCFEKTWDLQTGLVLSPTVWRKSAKEWYMWTTDGNFTMHLYTSTDGTTWSSGQPCSAPWDTWNGGYIPWHVAAKPNYLEQRIDFLIAGWPKQGTMKDCQLLYATAPMSQPKELSMPLLGSLLRPGAGDQWDNGYIYRSSFVLEPGDKSKFRIWYSACSKRKVWHIGYTEGTLDNIPSNTKQA